MRSIRQAICALADELDASGAMLGAAIVARLHGARLTIAPVARVALPADLREVLRLAELGPTARLFFVVRGRQVLDAGATAILPEVLRS